MTKNYEVWDERERNVFLTVDRQDQLLDALWAVYQTHRMRLSDLVIAYYDVFNTREYVAKADDEELFDWYEEMTNLQHDLHELGINESLPNLINHLVNNGYRVEFMEADYPPVEIDFNKYFIQLVHNDLTTFYDGATKSQAAAGALISLLKIKERE